MSKYDPLNAHLVQRGEGRVPMSFEQIESVIQTRLPPSARRHRAWWSNNPSNSVMTRAWLDAGYRTEAVNLEAGEVVFRRVKDDGLRADEGTGRHPVFGCMKGTMTIRADLDLTDPADPDWATSV